MAAGRIVVPGYMPAVDINTDPVGGAKLYVWVNRTTTLASIYTDEALETPAANPVVSDISGQFPTVWALIGTREAPVYYSLAVTDAEGGAIGSPAVYDDFSPSAPDDASVSAAEALASEEAAEAAQAAAELARDLAEAAALEAEVAAGASNTSGLYADTTAGLAGTTSGNYFGVPGADGIAYYRDTAGVAVAGPVQPSLAWVAKHQQVVPCYVVSSTNANNITIRPINSWTVLTGDACSGTPTNPRYEFTFKAPADSEVGSYNITVQNGDGSGFLGSTVLTNTSDETPGVRGIREGTMERFSRRPAVFTLERQSLADPVTIPLTDNLISQRKTPKPLRPVSTYQEGDNLCAIRVRLHEDHYSDFTLATQRDHLEIGYMNVKDFMGLSDEAPDGFMALNSLWANVRNQNVEVSNFVYRALDSGTTVETGLVWSAFENVLISGSMADAADTANWGTNFQLSGRAHGHVTDITRTRVGYRKDSSVGIPTAATKGAALTVTLNTTTQAAVGERIRFTNVVGMTQINDVWLTITGKAGNPSTLTFAGVNSTAYGTFVSCADQAEREVVGLAGAEPNEEWDGLRVVESASYVMNTPSGDPWANCSDVTTFASDEDYQIQFEWIADCGGADVIIDPGTRSGSYSLMCPMTGMNRAVGYVAGVQGTVQTIDTRDGAQTLFGHAEKVVCWNADFPDIQLVIENIAGVGYTHFADTGSGPVGVAYAADVFIANNDYGPKLYWPIYPVTAPVSLQSTQLSGGGRFKVIRAEPIV